MTRKLLLVAGLIIGTSSLGWAAACSSGTMADYISSGFSCTIGSLTFSSFSYTASALGGATAIPADGVTVTPQTGAEAGFMFNAPWVVSGGEGLQSVISYSVTATGTSISDLLLSMGGFGITPGASVTVAETTVAPPLSLMVFDNKTGIQASASATFAGVSSLSVTKGITVLSNSVSTGALSVVLNQFSTTGVVPEPASMLLLGSGLIGLAALVRRRRASRST